MDTDGAGEEEADAVMALRQFAEKIEHLLGGVLALPLGDILQQVRHFVPEKDQPGAGQLGECLDHVVKGHPQHVLPRSGLTIGQLENPRHLRARRFAQKSGHLPQRFLLFRENAR